MLLADDHPGSEEQLHIAMTRACVELMANAIKPRLADRAFTVGLVSALDLLLRATPSQVMAGLSLAPELVDALVGHTGVLGVILSDVLAWEVGGGELHPRAGLELAVMEKLYIEALLWANEVCEVLSVS